MSDIRLAWYGGSYDSIGLMERAKAPVSLLFSYYFLTDYIRQIPHVRCREWALDSGAFSAKKEGTSVNLDAYIETCLELLASEFPPCEVFSLDVIGDHKQTMRNTEKMWEAGIEAIPAFHVGSKLKQLRDLVHVYPKKIGLGAAVGHRQRIAWAKACFKAVWPIRVHGFGFGARESVLALPWHTTDATSWAAQPTQFAQWYGYCNRGSGRPARLSVRGTNQDMTCQVEYWLRVEREAKWRWRKQMKELESLP